MKITIKTLQQKVFHIDADGTDTVADLKNKIKESQGHPVEIQKLIYSGKVLVDDKSIAECEIKEKDFLVLMVSKPKPSPVTAPSSSGSSAPVPVQPQPAAAPAENTSSSEPVAASTPAVTSGTPADTSSGTGTGGSFLAGDALQSAIANMVDMGFPRDQVLRALRASFNNPDRAVEYLMTGIPAHLEAEMSQNQPRQPQSQPQSQAPAAAAQPAAPPSNPAPQVAQNLFQLAQQQQQQQRQGIPSGVGSGFGGGGGAGGAGPTMGGMPSAEQINNLRHQLTQNPELVQPLIQQISANNPALAQMLTQNPEALLQMLSNAGEFGEDGEGDLPPGAQVVSVTEEERAAIERLEALGFPRQAAIEAYFACDKNEELAANYLFEGGFDD